MQKLAIIGCTVPVPLLHIMSDCSTYRVIVTISYRSNELVDIRYTNDIQYSIFNIRYSFSWPTDVLPAGQGTCSHAYTATRLTTPPQHTANTHDHSRAHDCARRLAPHSHAKRIIQNRGQGRGRRKQRFLLGGALVQMRSSFVESVQRISKGRGRHVRAHRALIVVGCTANPRNAWWRVLLDGVLHVRSCVRCHEDYRFIYVQSLQRFDRLCAYACARIHPSNISHAQVPFVTTHSRLENLSQVARRVERKTWLTLVRRKCRELFSADTERERKQSAASTGKPTS